MHSPSLGRTLLCCESRMGVWWNPEGLPAVYQWGLPCASWFRWGSVETATSQESLRQSISGVLDAGGPSHWSPPAVQWETHAMLWCSSTHIDLSGRACLQLSGMEISWGLARTYFNNRWFHELSKALQVKLNTSASSTLRFVSVWCHVKPSGGDSWSSKTAGQQDYCTFSLLSTRSSWDQGGGMSLPSASFLGSEAAGPFWRVAIKSALLPGSHKNIRS